MNLDDIPMGSICVIDANVLLYAEQGTSLQAQRLLKRCSEKELIGTLPQPVWQELTHKLMLAEAVMAGGISGSNLASKLSRKPNLVKSLSLYRNKIRALIDLGLGFIPCNREDFFEGAFKLQEKYGLLTNDSIIVAIALRLQADVLVSTDRVFEKVKEIKIARPSDM